MINIYETNNVIFGWVSSEEIKSDWAEHSKWKSTGSLSDADKFFWKTVQEASAQGLKWFCFEEPKSIYHEEGEVSF